MPEEVSFNREKQYIHIRSYGEVTLQDLEDALEKALVYHREYQVSVVLVDAREQERLPDVREHYQFLKSLPAGLHVAILTNKRAETHGNQMFFAQAGQYKGKSIELFDDEAAAMKWVGEKAVKFKV